MGAVLVHVRGVVLPRGSTSGWRAVSDTKNFLGTIEWAPKQPLPPPSEAGMAAEALKREGIPAAAAADVLEISVPFH